MHIDFGRNVEESSTPITLLCPEFALFEDVYSSGNSKDFDPKAVQFAWTLITEMN